MTGQSRNFVAPKRRRCILPQSSKVINLYQLIVINLLRQKCIKVFSIKRLQQFATYITEGHPVLVAQNMLTFSCELLGCLECIRNTLRAEPKVPNHFLLGENGVFKYFYSENVKNRVMSGERGVRFLSLPAHNGSKIILPLKTIGMLSSSIGNFKQLMALENIEIENIEEWKNELEAIFDTTAKVKRISSLFRLSNSQRLSLCSVFQLHSRHSNCERMGT